MKPTLTSEAANFPEDCFEPETILTFVKRFFPLGPTGWFSAAVNKSSNVSLWLCLLPQLSLSPQSSPLVLSHRESSYSVGRGGQDRSHCTRPHNGWAVLLYQHLFFFFTLLLESFLPAGPISNTKSKAGRSVSLSVWDIAGSVLLTSGCHDSPWLCTRGSRTIVLILGCWASLIRVLLKLCIHEMQMGYLTLSRIYPLPAAHSVPIFLPCYVKGRRLFAVKSILCSRLSS